MKEILFPVGRMIGGSPTKLYPSKDNNNQPKFQADGTTPMTHINFGVAIKKGAEQHWAHTPWGAEIFAEGQEGFPNGEFNAPTFAWKITDGDSVVPNKRGKKPCDQTGYAGHWVIWFTQSWAPKVVSADGKSEITEADAILPGYFVQVFGSCKENKPSQSPGVYQNPIAVALSGYGEVIATASDVDTTSVGFGGTLPAGASAVPVGVTAPPAAMNPPVAGGPPVQPAALPDQGVYPPPVGLPAGVQPAPDFLNPASPPVPPVAPPAVPTMTAKANGATYESFIQNNWTDTLLIQEGYMLQRDGDGIPI